MQKIIKIMMIILLSASTIATAYHDQNSGTKGNETSVPAQQKQTRSDNNILPNMQSRVHSAGKLKLSITNMGNFGNPQNLIDPCTGDQSLGAEFNGDEYLYDANFWFGGYLDSVQTEQGTVMAGPFVSTGNEGWTGRGGSDDVPRELYPVKFDQDNSGSTMGVINESSNIRGKMNCLMEDVYDPAATAEEQFTTGYTDKFVRRDAASYNNYTGMCDYDLRDHRPLGIEVKQTSYAWSYSYTNKFIIIDYTIYNRNEEGKDIYNFFMGLYMDSDIAPKACDRVNAQDDLCGFIHNWTEYIDPSTGVSETIPINMAWAADNDGRICTGTDSTPDEPGAGAPLDGATGMVSVKVLRTPNPDMKYSFNIYKADTRNEQEDWGPHWYSDLHEDWAFDLSPTQKGYDDSNYDQLNNGASESHTFGRTEGRPLGDKGRYMVMSNGEFDYNPYDIEKVYEGTYEDPAGTEGTIYAQADKFQPWIEGADYDEFADGSIDRMKDIQNGMDAKYILSFGPLGKQTTIDIASDVDNDGVVDHTVSNKNTWKFQHGDSLKLTLAFMANDNFHTSIDQDPNEGIDPALFQQGWYDAVYNAMWAERIYDIPMYDTPVTVNGITKGDGWFGEDIGADGLFASTAGSDCWWNEQIYPGKDTGEQDKNITVFSEPMTYNGETALNEDEFSKQGNTTVSNELIGSTETFGSLVEKPVFPGSEETELVRYGYKDGVLTAGDGVPDLFLPSPPAPKLSVKTDGNDIVISWKSKETVELEDGSHHILGPEHYINPLTAINDFESYNIMFTRGADDSEYSKLLTIDRVNFIYKELNNPYNNYLGMPVDAELIEQNPDQYPQFMEQNGKNWQLVPFGSNISYKDNNQSDPEGLWEYDVTIDQNGIYTYSCRIKEIAEKDYSFMAVSAADSGDPQHNVPARQSALSANRFATSGGDNEEQLKDYTWELAQNYPNPFNSTTAVSYNVPFGNNEKIKLSLYNANGQLVKVISNKQQKSGHYNVKLNLEAMSTGVYYFVMESKSFTKLRKMVLLK